MSYRALGNFLTISAAGIALVGTVVLVASVLLEADVFAGVALIGAIGGKCLEVVMNKLMGYSAEFIIMKRARELVYVNSWNGNGYVNEEVFRAIRADQEQPHIRPEADTAVLLFLGPNTTRASEFAKTFVQHIAPLTPPEFEHFSSNKYTQILEFDYFHPNHHLIHCYLISLRMDKSKYYEPMLQIAAKLVPVATIACLLVDDQAEYAQPLLETLCPQPPQTLPVETPMQTWIMVVHPSSVNIRGIRQTLEGCDANYEPLELTDFKQENLWGIIAEVKRLLDISNLQPFTKFKEGVDSLPEALRPFRL